MGKKYLPQVVGPIKRVIRQNGHFICGICQDQHPKMTHALDCLHECWTLFNKLPPVVARKSLFRWQYRCRFCARDFTRYSDAKACGDKCLSGLAQRFETEWSLLDYTPPKKQKYQPKLKPLLSFRPQERFGSNPSEKSLSDSEITEPDETGPQSKEPIAPVHVAPSPLSDIGSSLGGEKGAETSGEVDEAEKDPKKKKERDHGFYRDGARYVCQVCNVKYFTKEDVMTCFNGHNKP